MVLAPAAYAYLQGACRQPVDRLKLRELDAKWHDLDLLQDVGVRATSIGDMAKKIKALNAKRPAANRKDQTECAERLLELIFQCSKHFHNDALIEYNRTAASWAFIIAAGPAAGQRDFAALTAHFDGLWRTITSLSLAARSPHRNVTDISLVCE